MLRQKPNSKPHRMSPIRSRLAVFATVVAMFIFLSYVVLPASPPPPSTSPRPPPTTAAADTVHASAELLSGNAIMPHLGNETIKSVPLHPHSSPYPLV